MANLTIAVLGENGYAKNLGKAGTASDITYYNLKREDTTVTFIEPTRYPERLVSLFYAVSTAAGALVVVDAITAQFGECVLMLDSAGIQDGWLVLKNYLTPEELAPLIRGTVVEHYTVIEDDPVAEREFFLSHAQKQPAPGTGPGTVPVDHAFPVKGIGTVVLGDVAIGTVRKHDTLTVLPGGKTVQVRSLQKHDDDADFAVQGDRVGVALKNIEAEELNRGDVLTGDKEMMVREEITAEARLVKYWPSALKVGMVLYLGHWMQFIPCRVTAVTDEGDWHHPTITLALEKPVVARPGDNGVLCYLEGGKLRVTGTIPL